jgi:hypothetical protein
MPRRARLAVAGIPWHIVRHGEEFGTEEKSVAPELAMAPSSTP